MLKGKLIHSHMLEVLGQAGHGSKVLVADGNYPALTTLGPNSTLITLNLSPGVVTCTQILEALVSAMPVELAAVMRYDRKGPHSLPEDPPVWNEFRSILDDHNQPSELEEIERFAFYDASQQPDVCMTILSGDQRVYANLLLTIGVIKPAS